MRILPNIRFGTEHYPEKIARRLRAVNMAAWLVALVPTYFTFVRLLEPERRTWAIPNALTALAFATVPFLHRFGPAVAPVALAIVVYVHLFRVIYLNGTGDGSWLTYLTGTTLAFLLLGIENVAIAAFLAAIGAGLVISVHIVLPHNTGLLGEQGLFYGHFVVNVVINFAVLFAVMYYAVRQLNRAEDAPEREHQRSERLLTNILPEPVAARLKEQPDRVIADAYEEASILFADLEGFTARATDLPPARLVGRCSERSSPDGVDWRGR